MNIDNEIVIVDITSKLELITYYDRIAELFLVSFDKPLNKLLWEWAYLNNPFGDPIVSIAMVNDKVVGHYAVVPMDLENKTDVVKGFLSMTTMVAVDFRRHQLFQKLAERVYNKIESLAAPAIVFGFPNDNSAPGFKKRLGWQISDAYKVVTLQPSMLPAAIKLLEHDVDDTSLTLNMSNSLTAKWRSNKPEQPWLFEHGIGIKPVGDSFDIMHLDNAEMLNQAININNINIVLPTSASFIENTECDVAFPYRFGFRAFNMKTKPRIFVQMSMSDVF